VIVAVSRFEQGNRVPSPCGSSLRLGFDDSPGGTVILEHDRQVVRAPARLLLPGPCRTDF
jgi:hypothetical protein